MIKVMLMWLKDSCFKKRTWNSPTGYNKAYYKVIPRIWTKVLTSCVAGE